MDNTTPKDPAPITAGRCECPANWWPHESVGGLPDLQRKREKNMNRSLMPLGHVMVGQKWTTQRELFDYWIRTEKMNDRGEPVCCNLDTGKLKPFNQLMKISAVVSSAFEPVPPWLPALRAELGSQDNRSTPYPLFIVQEVRKPSGAVIFTWQFVSAHFTQKAAKERGHEKCERLGRILYTMSKSQRLKLTRVLNEELRA